jgi:hypothetical protein
MKHMARNRDPMTADRWLFNMTTKLRPVFRRAGYELPGNIECHCGFTRSRNAAGEAHYTGDGQKPPRRLAKLMANVHPDERKPYLIMIDTGVTDSFDAAATLTHELIHIAVGHEASHKIPFQDTCRQLGLVMTSKKGRTEIDDNPTTYVWHNHPQRGANTPADNDPPRLSPQGVELRRLLTEFIKDLGEYPHKHAVKRPPPKPRMKSRKSLKFKCPQCPWVVTIGPKALHLNGEYCVPPCGNPKCENYRGACETKDDFLSEI